MGLKRNTNNKINNALETNLTQKRQNPIAKNRKIKVPSSLLTPTNKPIVSSVQEEIEKPIEKSDLNRTWIHSVK
ncbi:hypothetical protein M1146_05210 [Patescibacteria group bacterium]|nr:hypothetical protein [Patescibacteria group bacterium]